MERVDERQFRVLSTVAAVGLLSLLAFLVTDAAVLCVPFVLCLVLCGAWSFGVYVGVSGAVVGSWALVFSGWIKPWPIPSGQEFSHFAGFVVTFGTVAVLADRLRRAQRDHERLISRDGLTGLVNRQHFFDVVESLQNARNTNGGPISIAFIDCDNFKEVNDRWGHLTGDKVLQAVGAVLSDGTHNGETAARMGGDEFAILMPRTSEEKASESINALADALRTEMQKSGWPVTFSVGVATFIGEPPAPNEMVGRADEVMYSVKRSGKNAVRCVCGPLKDISIDDH